MRSPDLDSQTNIWENDKKMTLEFELDKMGSLIPTWTNKG